MLQFARDYLPLYFQGTLVAIAVTVLSMMLSVALGLVAALGRLSGSRAARSIVSAYVAFFRGIPPLVLLYVVYFGLPSWAEQMGIRPLAAFLAPLNNRVLSAVIAFGVNSGAYSTEIIRSAIASIPHEQMEAAQSLGMSYWLAMRRIIVPQSARVAFPPLGNEFIAVLKGTSLASVIGVTELMRDAQLVAAATFQNLMAYSLAGVYYVVLVIMLQGAVGWIEGRLSLAHK
jgi:His/Glu/Gln/Arg/opine family amino acid ABC transporter permease subunit